MITFRYLIAESIKGLIIESGFASGRNQLMRLGMSHLYGDVQDPIGFGNHLKIKDITIPTLIIHGEEDEIIPVTEGRTLYDLSGSHEKHFLYIPNAGHNDIMALGLEDYMGAIEKFAK